MRQVDAQVGTLSIVGCGAQGRRHLTVALTEHPEVHTVRTFDRSPNAVRALSQLAEGRRVVSARSASEAVEGADMVITALTAKLEPRLEADNAAGDAVFLPLDYDDAIAANVVNGATAYIVDDRAQYDSVLHRAFHGFREPDAELGDLVSGDARSQPRAVGYCSTWGSRWRTSPSERWCLNGRLRPGSASGCGSRDD